MDEGWPFLPGGGGEVKEGSIYSWRWLGTANGKVERHGSLQHFASKGEVPWESSKEGTCGDSA